MDGQEITQRVRSIIEAQLNTAIDFDDKDALADHGLDSLSSVEVTLDLEDVFSVTFNDEEMTFERFATIASIVNLLEEKLALSG
ncbi:acyl carrier protein [Streptomyces sp. NPDC057575]|uniref:acyl carrier protein n=1 Tax=unclassified Streptomyces TaxID=2593676 RepID=UPI003687E2C5